MIESRRRFLATGAYDRLSETLAAVAHRAAFACQEGGLTPVIVLDVGCGEGRHTRGVAARMAGEDPVAAVVGGIDVSKPAVARAAAAHRGGWYAVASAGDLPVPTGAVDVALDVFGPVVAAELARVVRPGGTVITAHPGEHHLAALRALVYADPRPHTIKEPLRAAPEWFERTGGVRATFPVVLAVEAVADLFAMTPYRWHAPPDIAARLAAVAAAPLEVDVVITSYRRTESLPGHRAPAP